MSQSRLTLRDITARPVVLKLKRPVVARIATITDWPLILIDLTTEEGIVGRSYLEPYVAKSMRYLVPALHDLGTMLKGRQVAPAELFEASRKSLHFVGYEGLSMIAASGLDMAAWDALAKLGTTRAAAALLKRYTFVIDPGITDQDEREAAFRGVLAAGDDALPAIRDFCTTADSVESPVVSGS